MYRFSIIVIVKNTYKYLSKCMDSIANQSFDNYEVIIVDDASSRKSDAIINSYRGQIQAIQYIYLNNSIGPGGARNCGLKIAQGEYIIFIDSDDWIDINCLEKANSILEKYSADIGMYSLVRNYDIHTKQPFFKCEYKNCQVLNGITAFKIMSGQYDFGIIVSPSPVNKIYKRTYLLNNNIFFLEHVYYEDILFAVQTLLANGKIVTIPDTKYHHYRRKGSIVQSLSQRHFDDLEMVFTNVKAYLKDNNLYQEYVYNFYKIFERFYNLLIRQVFEFSKTEEEKKTWIIYSFDILKRIVDINEYIQYFTAEDIRRHIQPYIEDTTLF